MWLTAPDPAIKPKLPLTGGVASNSVAAPDLAIRPLKP